MEAGKHFCFLLFAFCFLLFSPFSDFRKVRRNTMTDALGMIETRSFPAVVEAADAAVKAARVELVSYEKTGGGYTTIVVRGDVAAVRAACDAAQTAAGRVGDVVTVHVIARPHDQVDAVMPLGRTPAPAGGGKKG
jgi:microcompartment protein CcmL/EutN